MSYDILVIGGGPAGLSAAVNARARGRSVLVVSNPLKENPLWPAERVDNYPGLPGVSGAELLKDLRRHAEQAGAEFVTGRALSSVRMPEDWYVSVGPDMYNAKAVVLAAGVARGKKFPGEAEFLGRGVSYCATCDGMLYRDKDVAVLGYSDSARQEAEFLERIGWALLKGGFRYWYEGEEIEQLNKHNERHRMKDPVEMCIRDRHYVLRPSCH